MDSVHLLAQRITLSASEDMILTAHFGIDCHVWDIHGPHFDRYDVQAKDQWITVTGLTDDGKYVRTALYVPCPAPVQGSMVGKTLKLRKGEPLVLDFVSAIVTSNDGTVSAEELVLHAGSFDSLLKQQKEAWRVLWEQAAIQIEGDSRAEFAVNVSLYHLMSIAPRHAAGLSVPARGLSGQTYKGAIFWDTEMFMLDFYLKCMPEIAKSCLQYRIDSLPGALQKAKQYGFEGAFYAWESVEGGKDACSDYNVTDVFTGRPMRTYFRDKQVHISAAVVYGLKKYTERTGDTALLRNGGAEVIHQCARFYYSLLTRHLNSAIYDLNDVIGPDEYHERVNNNAYTNEMARMTLQYAAEIGPDFLPDVSNEVWKMYLDAACHIKSKINERETAVIEQFDGYFDLEDTRVDTVRSRLIDPKEYWGGAYGVAAQTQVIKQADVIALLYMLGIDNKQLLEANYDFYEPRTEHGSSLSACMYALCACAIDRPDAAYPLFLKSAEADLQGGGKQWAGLVYIGGTHPAAAGGAYMVLLNGFLGLKIDENKLSIHPRMPKGWKRIKAKIIYRGVRYELDTEGLTVRRSET